MQLGWAEISGLGRLSNASMKVRGKVTAVVGPNEAGKSTLLRGLASVSSRQPFTEGPNGDIPRRRSVDPSDIALTVTFVLDPEDHEATKNVDCENRPEKLTLSKTYGGGVTYTLAPPGQRPRGPRSHALAAITDCLSGLQLIDEDAPDEVRQSASNFAALADNAKAVLDDPADPETLTEEAIARLEAFANGLALAPEVLGDTQDVLSAVQLTIAAERADHPTDVIGSQLLERLPVFALFSDADRDLAYEYDLDGMTAASLPPALHNLAISAQLDVESLLADIAAQRWDAVAEHIEDANDALGLLFEAAWTAGSGTAKVYLQRDTTTLRVMVTSRVGRYSPISERSDGLRMFVALTAFVQAKTGGGRPVVLLIDEAENHLHYDAQADLMGVLARQELAAQVVYTTHSAGCLPDELGGNIVAVVPNPESGYSSIDTSYWTSGLGFTPLMMAMGAGAAAITPSRYAVLAEGHSEALILPRLIREATGLHRLGYQVAAGIAEAGRGDVPTLDAEAAHVAYLVDGDGGGKGNAEKLTRAGITSKRIIHLGGEGSGLCLESLVSGDVYSTCATDVRRILGRDPSKTDIAARLIDVDTKIVEPDKIGLLAELHDLLSDALQIPEDRRPKLTSK